MYSVGERSGGTDDHKIFWVPSSGITKNIKAFPAKSGFGPEAKSYKEFQNHNIRLYSLGYRIQSIPIHSTQQGIGHTRLPINGTILDFPFSRRPLGIISPLDCLYLIEREVLCTCFVSSDSPNQREGPGTNLS
ncbi:hypothetical protein TNCV_1360271 [Trichonephila clavipes]|nr:hypothetical protein TNCV_1360271 [Trichonephila clavipes]